MIELIALSKNKENKTRTIEAIFNVDNQLIPLKVNEDDRPEIYNEMIKIIENPNVDIENAALEMYDLMSPVSRVKKQISSSYYLSDNLSIQDGQIYFGDFMLEEALANHMLSLLDEENVPKDEILWKSYVRFLDNLHQNVHEDIRKQLFKWMEYENQAGNAFGITEDGCIVGYKGCGGTVLNPQSVFEGTAIVDGVEMTGKIPNKVGSVITMPRSAVQNDPSIGCSYGLHVGTRSYATAWAPILILVKVNPRDVVSVPYECDSQKMRVCEYTVLKVTDATEEHQRFHIQDKKYEYDDEYEYDEDDIVLDVDSATDLLNAKVYIEYDDSSSSFEGTIVKIHEKNEPGVLIKDDDGNYKHIKLYRINHYYVVEDAPTPPEGPKKDLEDSSPDTHDDVTIINLEDIIGKEIYVKYENGIKAFEGVAVDIYNDSDDPGIIIKSDNKEYKHIKLSRINELHFIDEIETEAEAEAEAESENSYDELLKTPIGTPMVAVYKDGSSIKSVSGKVKGFDNFELIIEEQFSKKDIYIPFGLLLSTHASI